MYHPRRAGRGTTLFLSDAWSALVVCAWCAGYSASDGIGSKARTTVHRWSHWHRVWFAKASFKEHASDAFRRDPSPRWWRLRPIAHCVIRRPYYLQIRNASTPPSPTRPRRRRHGRSRRVRIASGLRDPLRHVVVTALRSGQVRSGLLLGRSLGP